MAKTESYKSQVNKKPEINLLDEVLVTWNWLKSATVSDTYVHGWCVQTWHHTDQHGTAPYYIIILQDPNDDQWKIQRIDPPRISRLQAGDIDELLTHPHPELRRLANFLYQMNIQAETLVTRIEQDIKMGRRVAR